MGSSVTVKVNTRQINNALKEASERVERVSLERLKEAAEAGARAAEEGYAKAIYAGNLDAKVSVEQTGKRTYSIIATGQSVKFIEYGTGVYNPKSKWHERGYWFFTGDGSNFVNTAKAQKVWKLYYRTTRDEEVEDADVKYGYIQGGHLHFISEDDVRVGKEGMFYVSSTGQRYKVEEYENESSALRRVKTDRYPVGKGEPRDNSHSYITVGNPPNNVMRHAKNVMLRQFYSKYKTKYSRFEE